MTKEQVYDEQISPLMINIIAICKEHKIAFVASFAIPNEGDPDLRCTSGLTESRDESTEDVEDYRTVLDILRRKQPDPMMFTINHGDGTKTAIAHLDGGK